MRSSKEKVAVTHYLNSDQSNLLFSKWSNLIRYIHHNHDMWLERGKE